MLALVPPRGSVAAAVQAALPGSLVAAAFHHLPASEMEDLESGLDADVLVCSDHAEATAATMALVDAHRGLRPLDAGSLAQAAAIEAFTAVLHHAEHPLQGAHDAAAGRDLGRTAGRRREVDAALRHGPAASRALRAGSGRHDVHLRHHALRRRPPRARRGLPDLRRPPAPPARPRARDPAACATSPTSTTTSCARPASSVCTTSTWPPRRWPASTPTWRLLGLLPVYSRAAGHLGHPRHPLAHRDRARGGSRLPGRAARSTSTCRRFPRFGQVSHLDRDRDAGAWPPSTAATPTTRTSATRSTSCCGSPRCPTSRRGSRAGARAGPAGTSSARRWPCASSGRPSTSTAAGATSSSPTTSARRPSPSR